MKGRHGQELDGHGRSLRTSLKGGAPMGAWSCCWAPARRSFCAASKAGEVELAPMEEEGQGRRLPCARQGRNQQRALRRAAAKGNGGPSGGGIAGELLAMGTVGGRRAEGGAGRGRAEAPHHGRRRARCSSSDQRRCRALAGAEVALGKKAMLPCALELGKGWAAMGGEEAPNAQP